MDSKKNRFWCNFGIHLWREYALVVVKEKGYEDVVTFRRMDEIIDFTNMFEEVKIIPAPMNGTYCWRCDKCKG